MVSPGTGVSPLIAFLQYREALLKQGKNGHLRGLRQPQAACPPLGEAALYFGCRNHNDFIYQQKFQEWRSQGVLTQISAAFSRLPGHPKTYVQNLMQQNPQQVWQMLSHPQCHYYVCGDAKMADNVFETLLAIAFILLSSNFV